MGHLVNPFSLRLSINTFWNSNWTLVNNFNYNNLYKKDYILFYFMKWFLTKANFVDFGILISHYKIYKIHNRIFINLYYYYANWEDLKYKYNLITPIIKNKYKLNFSNSKAEDKNVKKNIGLVKNKRRLFLLKNVRKKIKQKIYLLNSKHRLNSLQNKKKWQLDISKIYSYIFKLLISNLYWQLLNFTLLFYSKKLNNVNDVFFFNIYNLNFSSITPSTITKYMAEMLKKKHTINWIIRPIIKDLMLKLKQKYFVGFKIVCSGRFSRKQIATHTWIRNGSVKLNEISSLIKYSETCVRLKYGVCGLKVWINYGANNATLIKRNLLLFYPIFLPFKYEVNKNSINLYLNNWSYTYIRIVSLKTKSYNFYLKFLKIKIILLLLNLIKRFVVKFYTVKYIIKFNNFNHIKIEFNYNKLSYLKALK